MLFPFDNIHSPENSTKNTLWAVSTYMLIDGILPSWICPSQPRECAQCLEGSFSSSKDANCCHYAFSLVLDFSPKNLYGHMPSHSGIGYCYPGANGTSPSLQRRLFWHSICLHVVPTNYSKSLLWLGIRRNDIWGFRFKFICKVKREHLNLFAFSTKILGYVVIWDAQEM